MLRIGYFTEVREYVTFCERVSLEEVKKTVRCERLLRCRILERLVAEEMGSMEDMFL